MVAFSFTHLFICQLEEAMSEEDYEFLQELIEIQSATLQTMRGMAQELKRISEGQDRDVKFLINEMNSLRKQIPGTKYQGIMFNPRTRQGRQQMQTLSGLPMRISALERRLNALSNRLHTTDSGDAPPDSSDD